MCMCMGMGVLHFMITEVRRYVSGGSPRVTMDVSLESGGVVVQNRSQILRVYIMSIVAPRLR